MDALGISARHTIFDDFDSRYLRRLVHRHRDNIMPSDRKGRRDMFVLPRKVLMDEKDLHS